MPSTPAGSQDRERPRAGNVAWATLTGVAWLVVSLVPLRALPRNADEAPGLDAHIYLAMAESPSVFTMPPFGYRLGVPLVAHLLPVSIEVAFFVITCTSLLACFVLAYLLFRTFGFGHGLSLLGMSFVAAAPEVSRYLGNYFLVDPAAVAFATALLLGIERGWPLGRLAFLLLIGSLIKESVLFVLPVLYVKLAEERWIDRRAARMTILVASPALVVAQLIVPRNEDRLLFFAYPVIIPLALAEFRNMQEHIPSWFPLIATLLAFSYFFAPGHLIAPLSLVVLARALMERGT